MEQSGAAARLAGVVHDLASEVVSALRGGGHSGVICDAAGIGEDDEVGVAAVRVLGADLLLPSTIFRRLPQPADLTVFRKAVHAFPPANGASQASAWSHWAMSQTLRRLQETAPAVAAGAGEPPARPAPDVEPDASWLESAPWQRMTHQVAVLGALAVPGTVNGISRAAAGRPVDVARGFVRAVRRRDWLPAAGAGRWLAVLEQVPATLGLDNGLEFVQHMGGTDPRVALHVQAARLIRTGAHT